MLENAFASGMLCKAEFGIPCTEAQEYADDAIRDFTTQPPTGGS